MMFNVVQKPAGGESGLDAALIMLLGSIVRCWSETGMNSCPEPMVRRRQPYSSVLFAMQAESQDNVWYILMLDLLARAPLCILVP